MNWRFIIHIFTKEGREILRDRRTLFVNVILPVLLYPVLAMAFIQLNQVAQSGPEDWTRIAIVNGDAELVEGLYIISEEVANSEDAEIPPPPAASVPDSTTTSGNPDLLAGRDDPLVLTPLDDEDAAWLSERAQTFRDFEDAASLHQETASFLRERHIALAIIADKDELNRHRYTILADNAHRRFAISWPGIKKHLDRLLDKRIDESLVAENLDPDSILEAQVSQIHQVAESGESFRVQIAGIIPIILVLLALSGAFMPAIDLIAGERERGTLETLLSLPGKRADIFTGKLLIVAVSALVNLLLNLTSLTVTITVIGSSVPGASSGALAAIDIGTIIFTLLLLLPLCLTLAAVCLGIAGLAASTKEAQNYLGPLFIAIMVPPMAAMIPTLGPGGVMNLVPVLGPVLVIKELLQSPDIPWSDMIVTTLASTAVAWVVIGWSARLLEQERFLFPGMVRAGWGRFRQWGPQPKAPSAVESLALFAACMGCFLAVSFIVGSFMKPGPATMFAQIAGLLAPVLIHHYLGDYQARHNLYLKAPSGQAVGISIALIPIAILLSFSLRALQAPFVPETSQQEAELMEKVFQSIIDDGGIFFLLLIASLTPGICEEFLCRGTLLSGLRKGLGVKGAIIVSAIIFGLMHMSPARFLPQAVLGIVLAILVLRSGSLWTAVILHAGHNGLVILIATMLQEHYGDQAEEELMNPDPAFTPVVLLIILVIAVAVWALLRRLPPIPND